MRLPEVVLVKIKIMEREKRLPRKLKKEALAGCWFAVITVVISCSTNCRQKKTNTSRARILNSAAISAGVLRIRDQLRKGFMQRNTSNKQTTMMLRMA